MPTPIYPDIDKYPFDNSSAVRQEVEDHVLEALQADTTKEHDEWMDLAVHGMSPLTLMEFLRDWETDLQNQWCTIGKIRAYLRERIDFRTHG